MVCLGSPSMKPKSFISEWSLMYVNSLLSGVDIVLTGQIIGHASSEEGKRLFAELNCKLKA
jgi:hypothetical protein